MQSKILLIDDTPQHFDALKEALHDYVVLPKKSSDLSVIEDYLEDKNEVNKRKVLQFFLKDDVDVIILDVKLWGNSIGGSILYDRILIQDNQTRRIPVIYVTSNSLQSEVTMNTNTGYVEKIIDSKGFNSSRTAEKIIAEIGKLKNNSNTLEWNRNNL